MMKNFTRAAFAASLIFASAGVVTLTSPASAADKVSTSVGKPLAAAQKLMTSGDFSGALAKVQEAQTVADRTPFDDYKINQFLAFVYLKQNDYNSATTAYEAMADSPAMPEEDKKDTFHNACLLSSQIKHYQKAIVYCGQFAALGPLDDQTAATFAEDYYFTNDMPHAQQYAQQAIDFAKSAGKQPNEAALQIVMSTQAKQNNQAGAEQALEQLALTYNGTDNWNQLIDVTLGTKGIKDQDALYLYRLREVAGAMSHPDDYTVLGSVANQLGYPTEAVAVLEQGISSGKITSAQAAGTLPKARRDAAADERALPSIAASAERSKTGEQDVKLGEDYWGYGRFADAEAAAQRAISKGGLKDPGEGPLLMGAAQVAQKKYADAGASRRQRGANENRTSVVALCASEQQDGAARRVRASRQRASRALTVRVEVLRFTNQLAKARRPNPRKSPYALLIGFTPVIVFALLAIVSPELALWAAFATAFAVGIRDFAQEPLLRLLDVASTMLFGLLALYAGFIQPGMPVQILRLAVDGGFFLTCLGSILIGRPITLQYARDQMPKETWKTRRFVYANYAITLVWTAAFAMMAAADGFANMNKELPLSLDIAAGLVALGIALVFTARFPAWLNAHA